MRDLLSDLNNYAWPSNWRYASETVNDVNASCGISSPQQGVNSMSKRPLDGDLCKNIFYFHINFFLVYKHDFIKCVDFVPVLQLQTQQVMTSQIRSHIEYIKHTYYILLLIL